MGPTSLYAMNKNNIYTFLLVVAIICIVGISATNVQQFAQYSKIKELIEEDNENLKRYDNLKMLYDIGLIDKEPQLPSERVWFNKCIATPYNCLNIPISIVFWGLAFISAVVFILSFSLKLHQSKGKTIKLYVLSSLSIFSAAIGVIYWAINFHW